MDKSTTPTAVRRRPDDDVRALGLFDGLSDGQLADLVAAGTRMPFEAGEELFREGRPAEHWWVLLGGTVELVRHVGRGETVLGRMDVPGRWAGGFRAWDDHGVYLATGRAATAGRVLRVPATALRAWSRREFSFGDHILEGLFRNAWHFQTVTREKESLVALGTLAAGLAHEINNPASAAARAAAALGEACDGMLASLRALAGTALTAGQYAALDELRRGIDAPAVVDPIDAADREEALAAWMGDHGVGRSWVTAPVLARAGVDPDWCDAAAAVLGPTALGPGLEWVATTVTAAGLIAEVQESTRRVSTLVGEVRSYSQLDRAPVGSTDVREGIDSTLVVLRHRIPPEVTVDRGYAPDTPRIEAVAAELNQVWTNLVTNALDAMDGAGVLRLTTSPGRDGGVVVEVSDTGSGMPPEVRQHVFDPFFTTKPVGRGTGLGLDIVRRIVDRHGGEVEIDSRPGATTFRVLLPAVMADRS
jgi:signal transduction histidine kinase